MSHVDCLGIIAATMSRFGPHDSEKVDLTRGLVFLIHTSLKSSMLGNNGQDVYGVWMRMAHAC